MKHRTVHRSVLLSRSYFRTFLPGVNALLFTVALETWTRISSNSQPNASQIKSRYFRLARSHSFLASFHTISLISQWTSSQSSPGGLYKVFQIPPDQNPATHGRHAKSNTDIQEDGEGRYLVSLHNLAEILGRNFA